MITMQLPFAVSQRVKKSEEVKLENQTQRNRTRARLSLTQPVGAGVLNRPGYGS